MLDKLQSVTNRYEELCAKSEQPDFYSDPKKAAALLREKNDMEPIVNTYLAYRRAEQDLADAQELMADPDMRELCQETYTTAKEDMSLLTKIIYIADYISVDRDYNGVEEMREAASCDLEKAIAIATEFTVNDLIKQKRVVHPDTLKAFNQYSVKRD